MRVLHVNKYSWPKGGSEIYALRLANAQAEMKGWSTGIFGSDPSFEYNITYFPVSVPDFHAAKNPAERVRSAGNVLWASKVKSALEHALDEFEPEIVHLHNYAHQLSPSIISLLRSRGSATVMTSHDYKLICPAYTAVRRGHDCFDCSKHLSFTAMKDRCLNNSTQWTAVALAESAFVRRAGLYPRHIIAPSSFMMEKLKSSWLPDNTEIYLVRNPSNSSGIRWNGSGGYLLYVGRLTKEKGVDSLIESASEIGAFLHIAGDGPCLNELKELVARLGTRNVSFLGRLGEADLAVERAGCLAQVLPSAWPENAPLAALEAAMDGVPLILSNRGGLPELIPLGIVGVIMNSNSPIDLAHSIEELRRTSSNGLNAAREIFGWKQHIDQIETIYEMAIEHPNW